MILSIERHSISRKVINIRPVKLQISSFWGLLSTILSLRLGTSTSFICAELHEQRIDPRFLHADLVE